MRITLRSGARVQCITPFRERDLILTTLNQYGGSRVQVRKTLGIHRELLNKKLEQYAAQGFTVPPPAKGWIVRDAARVARKKAAQERPYAGRGSTNSKAVGGTRPTALPLRP